MCFKSVEVEAFQFSWSPVEVTWGKLLALLPTLCLIWKYWASSHVRRRRGLLLLSVSDAWFCMLFFLLFHTFLLSRISFTLYRGQASIVGSGIIIIVLFHASSRQTLAYHIFLSLPIFSQMWCVLQVMHDWFSLLTVYLFGNFIWYDASLWPILFG